MKKLLVAELGADWQTHFDYFDPIPIASASIGQVHRATVSPSILNPTPSRPTPIALKVQFPNIAASISSDLANISTLLNASALLPRGLYLDRTLAVMRGELADECDYEREATAMERFGDFLGRKQERFRIPKVLRELTTKRVLAMEWMEGISIAKGAKWPKHIRDQVGNHTIQKSLRLLIGSVRSRETYSLYVFVNYSNSGSCKQTQIGRTSCTIRKQISWNLSTLAHLESTARSLWIIGICS